jgi:hypothetical protein
MFGSLQQPKVFLAGFFNPLPLPRMQNFAFLSWLGKMKL